MSIARAQLVLGVALTTFCAADVQAYETHTHAYMTSAAYDRSVFGGAGAAALSQRLGFDRLDASRPFFSYWVLNGLGDAYHDNQPVAAGQVVPLQYIRKPNDYERNQMLSILSAHPADPSFPASITAAAGFADTTLPLRNWLVRGAIREDDLVRAFYWASFEISDQPDADPSGTIVRVFNHFYDPIHDAHLPDPGLPAQYGPVGPALEWAMGTQNALISPQTVNDRRRNHFSWEDARNNYWLAMTNERGRDTGLPYSANERAQDSEERMYRWATVFRSLGAVMHLVQDMARPQHTRIDAHSPADSLEQQAFEPYTNARTIGPAGLVGRAGNYIRGFFGEESASVIPPVVTGSYPVVRFAIPRKYFTTRTSAGNDAVSQRGGMADYSNRGFFTAGTLPPNNFADPPQNLSDTSQYTPFQTSCRSPHLQGAQTFCTKYLRKPPDTLNPAYTDAIPTAFLGQGGKIPMSSKGMFASASALAGLTEQTILSLDEFQVDADFLIPRAISYSAGLIDLFFRGQLEVLAPTDRVVAVLNQGALHSMNSDGYPCVGSTPSSNCTIFGFKTVRVRVRNATDPVVESGSGTSVPQNTGGGVSKLVAVARYHRNTCYKPDLSGERVQSYSTGSPAIAEPVCSAGQTVRTEYQEISVSNAIAVTAGELDNRAAGTGIDKIFDFTNDPIPVNATDLFIQVVCRGPMGDATLGLEDDGIAVGTLDVREPTFATFWNNSDYFWNGSAWLAQTASFPNMSVGTFYVCGGGFPVKLIYEFAGAVGSTAMPYPIPTVNAAGAVRLGIVFPPPDSGSINKSMRAVPITDLTPHLPVRSVGTKGEFRQADKEQVRATTLLAPMATCNTALPSPPYWCSDTVLKRRGQIFGAVAQPLYLASGTDTLPDVDAAPALPVFAGVVLQSGGNLRFDTDTTLATCPAGQTLVSDSEHALIEEARSLGVPQD